MKWGSNVLRIQSDNLLAVLRRLTVMLPLSSRELSPDAERPLALSVAIGPRTVPGGVSEAPSPSRPVSSSLPCNSPRPCSHCILPSDFLPTMDSGTTMQQVTALFIDRSPESLFPRIV